MSVYLTSSERPCVTPSDLMRPPADIQTDVLYTRLTKELDDINITECLCASTMKSN